MHTKRIIPCLDVKDGRVVKGVNFVNLKDAGDPAEIASAYDKAGADEVVFLDITASSDARNTQLEWVRQVASKVFIPFTVGGGIRTVEDFKVLLREGADKISINSSNVFHKLIPEELYFFSFLTKNTETCQIAIFSPLPEQIYHRFVPCIWKIHFYSRNICYS